MKEILLEAPDSIIDASMKPLIEKWSDPTKALEILEVLDYCIHGSLAAGFVVSTLQILYNEALQKEGLTHEELTKSATWRETAT